MVPRVLRSRGDDYEVGSPRTQSMIARTRAGRWLLPGACLLLAFQLFVAYSGDVTRLQQPEQDAFAISLLNLLLSVLLLTAVSDRREARAQVKYAHPHVELTLLLLLAGVAALAGALASDFFVITTRITGSPGEGGLVGVLVLVLVCLPWF